MSRLILSLVAALLLVSGAVLIVSLSSGQDANDDTSTNGEAGSAEAPLAEVVFPPAAVFDHDFHIDDVELECVECHHETEALRLKTPHPQYFEDLWITCDACHHSDQVSLDPQACVECHPRSPSGIKEQIISAKVATHLSCWECHDSGRGVEASENCSFCHQED